jgi:hypothetical protein
MSVISRKLGPRVCAEGRPDSGEMWVAVGIVNKDLGWNGMGRENSAWGVSCAWW